MKANNRHLLAIALATVLLSPAAWAQKEGKGPPDMPRVAPTAPAPVPNSPEQTMRDIQEPVTTTTEQADTPPPSPPQSQGAEHAATHSSIVQRDQWTRLDTNGDGRISATEGEADAAFNADFSAIDSDDDGFVTDVEYRSAAKAETRTDPDAGASSRATGSGSDVLRRLDANADGSVSLSEGEADATIRSNFSSIDADSDGMVSRAEYQAWLKANRK